MEIEKGHYVIHTKHLWTIETTNKKGPKIINVWDANSSIYVMQILTSDKCYNRDKIW